MHAALGTPKRALTSTNQGAVAGPSTDTGASSSKLRRVYDPVTRPRLGDIGFIMDQYVSSYSGDFLDANRFCVLREGKNGEKSVPFRVGRNNREVTRESCEGAWGRRWATCRQSGEEVGIGDDLP